MGIQKEKKKRREGIDLIGPARESTKRRQVWYLEEDGKVNDGNGGRDKERLLVHFLGIDEKDESEGDGTSQTTVRHDKLLDVVQLVQAEAIGDFREHDNT